MPNAKIQFSPLESLKSDVGILLFCDFSGVCTNAHGEQKRYLPRIVQGKKKCINPLWHPIAHCWQFKIAQDTALKSTFDK